MIATPIPAVPALRRDPGGQDQIVWVIRFMLGYSLAQVWFSFWLGASSWAKAKSCKSVWKLWTRGAGDHDQVRVILDARITARGRTAGKTWGSVNAVEKSARASHPT